jgi:hypothetical protein
MFPKDNGQVKRKIFRHDVIFPKGIEKIALSHDAHPPRSRKPRGIESSNYYKRCFLKS